MAADVSLPVSEAQQRVVYLAGAVFESLVETALQENRKMVLLT